MSESAPRFGGSMAESYARYLVPILFTPYARDLASRLPDRSGANILELACGTGVVTRELLCSLPVGGSIHATDLSQAMLDYATAHSPSDSRLRWQVADAQNLT